MEKTINYKKLSIHTLIIVAIILFVAISLQSGFAATTTIDNTTSGGISGALNSSAPGDIIELDEGTYTGNNNTNMTINKNITIQGKTKDKVILDAQGLSGIFTLADNLNLTLINITFLNGNVSNGGAIYNLNFNTSLNIINCIFKNNNAVDGGAIDGGANIYNSTFIDNFALSSGGALRLSRTTQAIEIINCTFINNKLSNLYGGAICVNKNNVYIENSFFSENKAQTYGGGIFIGGSSTNVTVNHCIFENDVANNGASIGIGASTMNITISNSSISGGISNSSVFVNSRNATINNNNISGHGDGIHVDANGIINIADNKIVGNGGNGITNNGNVTIENNLIVGNSGDNVVNDGDLDGSGNTIDYRTDLIIISTNVSFNRVTVTVKASDQYGDIIVGATINFYVNGVLVGSAITNSEGIAEFAYNASNAGVQNILTYMPEFNGTNSLATTSIHLAANNTTTTNVTKLATNSTIIVSNATNGKQTTVSGVLVDENGNPISGASLNVVIGGNSYSVVTGADGKWELLYTPSKAGNYNAKVYYTGDNLYLASTGSVAYNVAQEQEDIPTKVDIRLVKRNNSKAVRHGNVVYMKWLTFKNFGASGSQTINAKIIIKNLKYKLWKVYNKKLNYKFAKNNIKFKLNLKSNGVFKLKLKVYRPIR